MVLKSLLLSMILLSSSFAIYIKPTSFDLRSLTILVSQECNKNIILSKDLKNLNSDFYLNTDIDKEALFEAYKNLIQSKSLFLNEYDGYFIVDDIDRFKKPINNDNIKITMKIIEINNEKFNSDGFKSLLNSNLDLKWSLSDLQHLNFDSSALFQLDGLLSVLEDNGYIKVVSEPHILIGNGKTTILNVGETVSVLVSALSDDTTSTNQIRNTYKQEDVGLSISATPTIDDDSNINLKLLMKLETLKDYSDGLLSTKKKSYQSEFNIKDGGATIVGGLKSEQIITNTSKLPFFGDLPFLKYLFSYDSSKELKTTLSLYIKADINKPISLKQKKHSYNAINGVLKQND